MRRAGLSNCSRSPYIKRPDFDNYHRQIQEEPWYLLQVYILLPIALQVLKLGLLIHSKSDWLRLDTLGQVALVWSRVWFGAGDGKTGQLGVLGEGGLSSS